MTATLRGDVTQLLMDWSKGDREALDKLVPLVYSELRRLSRHYLSRQRRNRSLQTTALINEAFVRLIDQKGVSWQNRAHFLSAIDPSLSRLVELRVFFECLTIRETAEVLGVSPATVKRGWTTAKISLRREIARS